MQIKVNGETRAVHSDTLEAVLEELGYGDAKVATAVNGDFVPRHVRQGLRLSSDDALDIVTPKQGG